MTYYDLLKARADLAKIAKLLVTTEGGLSSLYTKNLDAMIAQTFEALCHFVDHRIQADIGLRDERMEGTAAQASLAEVPVHAAIGARELGRAIRAFLDTRGIEVDDAGRREFSVEFKPAGSSPTEEEGAEEAESDEVESDELPEGDEEHPSVATVLGTLRRANPARPLSSELVGSWTTQQRRDALVWARTVADAEGGDVPPPDVVSARYLEDLDLDTDEGLRELLGWLGYDDVDPFLVLPERDAIAAWATAAHRFDRGSLGADDAVPEIPAALLPSVGPDDVLSFVRDFEGPCHVGAVLEQFGDDAGSHLVLKALFAAGMLVSDAEGALTATTDESIGEAADELVRLIGQRSLLVEVADGGNTQVCDRLGVVIEPGGSVLESFVAAKELREFDDDVAEDVAAREAEQTP